MSNIFQQIVTVNKPKVLAEERIFVYVPKATTTSAGIAYYNDRDFNISNGYVSLNWSTEMEVEQLSDPITTLSRVKLLADEFKNTNNPVTITNPLTGATYTSLTGEVKLNRENRNAFNRPDLIMLRTIDFETEDGGDNHIRYKLKENNPLKQPSLVHLDSRDFNRGGNKIVDISWPYAHNVGLGTSRTDGYGLVKIADGSLGHLKYENDLLSLDFEKVSLHTRPRPIYGADEMSGFLDHSDYVDENGLSRVDLNDNPLIKITKDAVGLSKVENKAFNEYQYSDFGTVMKHYFQEQFGLKLNKAVWDQLFSDWSPPAIDINTVQKWFNELELEDDSLWHTINTLKKFLGYFETIYAVTSVYTPNEDLMGSSAFVLETNSYWAIRLENGEYEWYDTEVSELDIMEFVETNANAFLADGIPSAGSSAKWSQSDHVHPTDQTRLALSIYRDTVVNVSSEYDSDNPDFTFNLWEVNENEVYVPIRTMNIPYVRKGQSLHNYQGQLVFEDSVDSSENYWAGTNEQFITELDDIKNNSLIMVDEGDSYITGEVLFGSSLAVHGISINITNPEEKFVIVENDAIAEGLVGLPLTLSRTKNDADQYRYMLEAIDLGASSNKIITTVSTTNGMSLQSHTFNNTNRVIVSDNSGNLDTTSIHSESLLASDYTGAKVILPQGQVLITSSSLDNTITTLDTGEIMDRLIVSDGFGGIKNKGFNNLGTVLIAGVNHTVNETTFAVDNLLLTANSTTPTVLDSGELLVSGSNNTVATFSTGSTANKLIVSTADGGVQLSTLPANKIMYTSAQGILAGFPMTPSDSGKVLTVDVSGMPTLASPAQSPVHLPVSAYTTDPGPNLVNNSLTICKLSADPGTYSEGVLYLW